MKSALACAYPGSRTIVTLPRALVVDVFFAGLGIVITASVLLAFIPAREDALRHQTLIYVICVVGIGVGTPLNRVPDFTTSLTDGSFVRFHVRPQPLFLQFYFFELGVMVTRSLPTGALIMCAAFLDNPPGSLTRAASGFISVISGGALAASIVVTFYILTAFTKRDSGPRAVLQGFSALLSGQLVPLAFWPASLSWVSHQPFAYVADQPARVLLGSAAMTSVVMTQVLWTAFFCVIGSMAAERHFRLREAVGA